MTVVRVVVAVVLLVVVSAAVYLGAIRLGWFGRKIPGGEITRTAIPDGTLASHAAADARAATGVGASGPKQILFGDLHVHTTYSNDAFYWALPLLQGEGAHPVSDACDFARFCSGLDFWSINDHAEASTPRTWRETKDAIRACNAVAGDPRSPDVVAFLGWEWSQVGTEPSNHYGHKNVIFRDLGDDQVPTRPIGALGIATDGLRKNRRNVPLLLPILDFPHRQVYYDFQAFISEVRDVPFCRDGAAGRELPSDCYEAAATPRELFDRLDAWGFDTIVIPHGTTWGLYTPPGSTLDKQLDPAQNDPRKQTLIEVMSGHGNSEQFRRWREVEIDASGAQVCPKPTREYLPSCWRAGEIIRERCAREGAAAEECERRAADARMHYVAAGVAGHLTVPGEKFDEWLDAGQCRDCFIPAFNYRPRTSVQYGLAISRFDGGASPQRFRWGFIGSSDNHRARPGTGYKEYDRLGSTEAHGYRSAEWERRAAPPPEEPVARARPLSAEQNVRELGFDFLEEERQSSFFLTGGLAAVHAEGRDRNAVWSALKRREVYGTSGDRILLWFDLLNAPGGEAVPMGSAAEIGEAPRFRVRAVGALKQKPGCPEYSGAALGSERLAHLCKGECYHPSDERKLVTRIEVVRVRPQARPGEPVEDLIEDPWRVLPCAPDRAGCVVEFDDAEFAGAGRDTVYYVRAIEEPSDAVNAGQLRCELDEHGDCAKVRPCYGDYRVAASDDCLAPNEERAWSSPIYVDHAAAVP